MVATWILFLTGEKLKCYQAEMEATMDKYLEIIYQAVIFEAEKVFKGFLSQAISLQLITNSFIFGWWFAY